MISSGGSSSSSRRSGLNTSTFIHIIYLSIIDMLLFMFIAITDNDFLKFVSGLIPLLCKDDHVSWRE